MWQKLIEIFASPILVGVILYCFQSAAEKRKSAREKEAAERDELRDEIEAVNREVNNATMELTYATSLAVSEHKCNGELHRAQEAYNTAVRHRDELGKKLIEKEGKE